MKVNLAEAGALKGMLSGKTYHFCSALCRDKFDKNPEQYLGERQGKTIHSG